MLFLLGLLTAYCAAMTVATTILHLCNRS